MKTLDEIKYQFIINLTKFFLYKYKLGEIKNLEQIISIIKSMSPFLTRFSYIFDETIWLPNDPESYNNLIQFGIQLAGNTSYLPFRLFVNGEMNQEALSIFSSVYKTK